MNEIWKIALAVVGSIGGVGAIIIATSSFLAKIISDKIIQKTEYRFSKELEDFKSQLEKKIYISKTRFDAEFKIYQDISGNILKLIGDTSILFPAGLDTGASRDIQRMHRILRKRLTTATKSYNKTSAIINQYAMFIPKKTYEMFKDILLKCLYQIVSFPDICLRGNDVFTPQLRSKQLIEHKEKTVELQKSLDTLVDYVRNYLQGLEVKN